MDMYVFSINEFAEPDAVDVVSKGRSRVLPAILVGLLMYLVLSFSDALLLGSYFDRNFR
jgi:ABC-type tungstate transport system substrate-binding protein